MKKVIVLLSIIIFFVTGCSVTPLESTNISKNMKILLSDKTKRYNTYFDGYKYYIPKGLNKESHYSKRLNYNNKTGYIQIDKTASKYFVQFVYNYAKMEAYVEEKDLASVVDNMCYILRSIKFHDSILESLVGENILNYKEENFTLFKADSSKESFLDVVSKYEDESYKEAMDEGEFELENES